MTMQKHIAISVVLTVGLFLTIPFELFAQTKRLYNISGVVLSSGTPIPYADVYIEDLRTNVLADEDGKFVLTRIPQGKHKVQTSSMGYNDAEKWVTVSDKDVNVKIYMSPLVYEIDQIQVMAKRDVRNKLEIKETAIEYVQPVSLADVMVLLPGNVYQDNAMTKFSLNTNRQVGSDQNTSLGIGVTTDGVPQTSDGNRTQMIGLTANSYRWSKDSDNDNNRGDDLTKGRSSINSGTDMRYISTDHIQSVEYTKGISSPRYGNLSSGHVKINSKYGVSPLRVRTKIDLKNKLVYAGKGFSLGPKVGTLYVGADYLNAIDDVREEMDKFQRLTGQAYYNNKFRIGGYTLDFDAKVAQTISVNKMKKDELTYEYNETYKADYSKTDFMAKMKLNLGKKWIDNIEWTNSLDRTEDRVDRHYCVITANPRSMPKANEEGEHEGYYLPTMYYSDFYVENTPVNYYSQLNLDSRFTFGKRWILNVEYGADFHSTKNWGDGAVIEDPERPPFPNDNSYMRPRKNWEIPAIEVGGAYLHGILCFKATENQTAKIDAGGRLTEMFNLPSDYALCNKLLTEPRINANYAFGKKLSSNIRFGYGEENKLPTMDYLYPEKTYKDFWMLNAYSNNPANRHLITYTKIYDATNTELRENKNHKIEFGYDASIKGFELSVTLFHEFSKTGFEYFKLYEPVTYPLYTTLKEDADISNRRPEKTDYVEQSFSEFVHYSKVMNSKKTTKDGLEYRLIFPKIKPLQTNIEINGAYYETTYGSSQPDYFYPNSKVGDNMYPYVGVYDLDAHTTEKRFNSNFWFNTHIPRFRLIFTNFFQLVWMQTKQYSDNFDGIYKKTPFAYIDTQNKTHIVTPEVLEKIKGNEDISWYQLKRQTTASAYAKDEKPVYLLWNIKSTKELNDWIKLSFFVNGILDVHPKYISKKDNYTQRKWSQPFFGMELILNIGNNKKGDKK